MFMTVISICLNTAEMIKVAQRSMQECTFEFSFVVEYRLDFLVIIITLILDVFLKTN